MTSASLSPALFPAEEYQQRRARVLTAMAEQQLDAMIVTAAAEVYYFSGLHNQGHFVFTALVLDAYRGAATLVAREMEAPTVAAQTDCAFAGYPDGGDPADVLADAIPRFGGNQRRIGYQANSLSLPVAVWQRLDKRLSSPAWIDCTDLLARVQALRSNREIACLREAGRLSDVGMRAGIAAAAGDCSGGEIVAAVQHAMFAAGSDYPGCVPMVRRVEQIRQEHVVWTPDAITAADSLFFELSAATGRYHAPLGRTVRPHGDHRDQRAADLAHAGLEAIAAALQPGRTAEDAYRDWKTTIDAGLGRSYQRHHCGYSVGIGFPPSWMSERIDSLRPGNAMILQTGMSFHLLSWIIDDQAGTHATSDTALVTPTGGELLTITPHQPARPA